MYKVESIEDVNRYFLITQDKTYDLKHIKLQEDIQLMDHNNLYLNKYHVKSKLMKVMFLCDDFYKIENK
jgi:hypothetical protein